MRWYCSPYLTTNQQSLKLMNSWCTEQELCLPHQLITSDEAKHTWGYLLYGILIFSNYIQDIYSEEGLVFIIELENFFLFLKHVWIGSNKFPFPYLLVVTQKITAVIYHLKNLWYNISKCRKRTISFVWNSPPWPFLFLCMQAGYLLQNTSTFYDCLQLFLLL